MNNTYGVNAIVVVGGPKKEIDPVIVPVGLLVALVARCPMPSDTHARWPLPRL